MADEEINVLLSLQDKFTLPIKNATVSIKDFYKNVKETKKIITSYGKTANKEFLKVTKGAAKMGASLSKSFEKNGFDDTLDLDGHCLKLDNATKYTQKAGKAIKAAIQVVNNTPFGTGKMTETVSEIKEIDTSAEKWLLPVGTMAVLMTNQIVGVVEKQTSTMKEMWSTITGATQTALSESLVIFQNVATSIISLLEELKGNIQTVADTLGSLLLSGMIEGISNSIGSVFAESGNAGSVAVLEIKDSVDLLNQTASEMSNSFGVLDLLSSLSDLSTVIDGVSAAYGFLTSEKAKELVVTAKAWVVTAAQKAQTMALTGAQLISQGATIALTTAQWALNAAMTFFASPVGLVVLGIMALIAVGVLLYKNWDKIKQKSSEIWEKITSLISGISKVIVNVVNWLVKAISGMVTKVMGIISEIVTAVIGFISGIVNSVMETVAGVIEFIVGVLNNVKETVGVVFSGIKEYIVEAFNNAKETVTTLIEDIKSAFENIFNSVKGTIDKIVGSILEIIQPILNKVNELIEKIKENGIIKGISSFFNGDEEIEEQSVDQFSPKSHNATGTPYFKGGLTHINEGGRGEIVNLPNGTQIIPHDIAKSQNSQPIVNVSVNVQGNVIGNNEYANYIGSVVARRVVAAYGNM